jgi:HK97 family phage prohead protease
MSKLTKAFPAEVRAGDGERAVTAVITTSAVDRDGEVVLPQGLNAKEYEDNAVLLFNHDYWSNLPIGKCVGLAREKDSITAKFVFADRPADHPEGEEWLPSTILSLYQQGVMNAFSIGFIPTETRPATDKDVSTFGAGVRRVISKSKLLEVSAVIVPCNQEAVALAVSKGLKAETAKKLFGWEAKAADDDKPADPPAEKALCPDCGGEMAEDGTCAACAEKAKGAEPPEEKSFVIPEPAPAVPEVKAYAFQVPPPAPDGDATSIEKSIDRTIARARGAIYIV